MILNNQEAVSLLHVWNRAPLPYPNRRAGASQKLLRRVAQDYGVSQDYVVFENCIGFHDFHCVTGCARYDQKNSLCKFIDELFRLGQ